MGIAKINHPELGDLDTKRQVLHIFSYIWMLAFEFLTCVLQSE